MFVKLEAFAPLPRTFLPPRAHLVDCVVGSERMGSGSEFCPTAVRAHEVVSIARSDMLEKRSSSATRLSERLACSLGLLDGIINTGGAYYTDVDADSIDLSAETLQGQPHYA